MKKTPTYAHELKVSIHLHFHPLVRNLSNPLKLLALIRFEWMTQAFALEFGLLTLIFFLLLKTISTKSNFFF